MRGTRLWLALALIAALFATALVAGCGDDDDDDGTATEESTDEGTATAFDTLEEGKLTIGLDTPYPPFDTGHPPDVSGYDVEVMNGIGEELGLPIDYIETGFGTIFRDTANGQFDAAAAASDITEERERVVDFTDPYYLSSHALLVPTDSDIRSVDDLGDAIVAVQDGTTQQDYLEDETDAGDIRGFPEGPNAVQALVTGQADAVLTDLATGALAVEEEDGIEVVEEIPTDVFFGFAVTPDNDALREAMNEALATLKDNGTIDDLYQKYFDAKAPEEVLTGTNPLLNDN
jgi:ABC-type amino acid transport substrate-binding protein